MNLIRSARWVYHKDMTNTQTTTTTAATAREAALAEIKALEATMFAAQDAWDATDYMVPSQEREAYKVARFAFLAARSAWINA